MRLSFLLAFLLLFGVPASAGYVAEDGAIRLISGNHGMRTILEKFDDLFAASHPGAKIRLEFNRLGNSINIPSIAYGTTLLAPMGREAMPAELLPFRQAVGSAPLVIRFAHGTLLSQDKAAPLAIYVNKANPLEKLTMGQIERIFTSGAAGGDITRWGQLGLEDAWAPLAIHTYGTPEISGFGFYMLQQKMHGRTFRPGYEAFPLAAQIVKRVGEDVGGIGFAALGFLTPEVKLVPVAEEAGGPYSAGGEDDVINGRYPLDRYVYFYLRDANDPLARDYVSLVLSSEGQRIIAEEKGGFLPLNSAEIAEEIAKLRAPAPPVDAPVAAAIIGDDRMAAVVDALNALFHGEHPEISLSVSLKGPSTGIAGLTAGVSLLAPMAREAWPVEIEPFKRLTGFEPIDIHIGRIGKDLPGVYVNAANPLSGLSFDQMMQIFSQASLSRWSQLGWSDRAIHLYGPRDDGKFASTLMKDRPFAPNYEAVADPLAAAAADRFGIALAEQGSSIKGVKRVLPLPVFLRFYVANPSDPMVAEFLRLALSAKGQAAIRALGYLPLEADEISGELSKLQ